MIRSFGTRCGKQYDETSHWYSHGEASICGLCDMDGCERVFVDTATSGPLPVTHAEKFSRLRRGDMPTLLEANTWRRRAWKLRQRPGRHPCRTWRELLTWRRNQLFESRVLYMLARWVRSTLRDQHIPRSAA